MEAPITEFYDNHSFVTDLNDYANQLYTNGLYYLQIGQPQIAVQYLKKAAFNNHPAAQHEYGRCYEMGIGLEPNQKRAMKWYQRAEQHGYIWHNADTQHAPSDTIHRDTQYMPKEKEEVDSLHDNIQFMRDNLYVLRDLIHGVVKKNLVHILDEFIYLLKTREDTQECHAFFQAYTQFQEARYAPEQYLAAFEQLCLYASDLNILDAYLELDLVQKKVPCGITPSTMGEAHQIIKAHAEQPIPRTDSLTTFGIFSRNRPFIDDEFSSSADHSFQDESSSSHTSEISKREERKYLTSLVDDEDAEISLEDHDKQPFHLTN